MLPGILELRSNIHPSSPSRNEGRVGDAKGQYILNIKRCVIHHSMVYFHTHSNLIFIEQQNDDIRWTVKEMVSHL